MQIAYAQGKLHSCQVIPPVISCKIPAPGLAEYKLPVPLKIMNLLLIVLVLLLLFGGGGFYFGGPAVGGGGLGLILVICLVVYLLGGFRTRG
jgi:hypothetical protein